VSSEADRSASKTSNRLSHGLSSKVKRESWFDDVKRLADELMGDTPTTGYVIQAAMEVAHTVILLRSIRIERNRTLSTPQPPRSYHQFLADDDFEAFRLDVIESGFCREPPTEKWAQSLKDVVEYPDRLAAYKPCAEDLLHLIYKRKDELTRIDEYERKALSRLKKQITRLDYVSLEAKRRKHTELVNRFRERTS
jgi:hypothetical protein